MTSPRLLPEFHLHSAFGPEAEWTLDYLEHVAPVLVRLFDNPEVRPPPSIEVALEREPGAARLGGFAAPGTLGFRADVWPKERHRLWLVAHELANLMAAHYAGGGGFPSDWWANGRSP